MNLLISYLWFSTGIQTHYNAEQYSQSTQSSMKEGRIWQ